MTEAAPSTSEVIQRLLTRIGARDAIGTAQLFASQVDCRSAELPGAPWPSSARTQREVEAFFLALFQRLEFQAIRVRRIIVDGDDAVVIGSASYRALQTDRRFSQDFVVVLSVRQGLIREYQVFEDTLRLAMAMGTAYAVY